jgi:hypothetical protein
MSGVALVQFSAVDLSKLLPLGRQAFDRNLADAADAAAYEPPLHHMLCIAALKSAEKMSAESAKPYLNMFHAGFLLVADERDCAEILELAGMPAIMVDTIERGLSVIFIAGTLAQWQDAMLKGCQKEVSHEARHTYNMIFTEFKNVGLAPAFSMVSKPNTRDQTFLLEYKP